jgi:hypothetical protein
MANPRDHDPSTTSVLSTTLRSKVERLITFSTPSIERIDVLGTKLPGRSSLMSIQQAAGMKCRLQPISQQERSGP